MCGCMGCALSHFSRAHHKILQTMPVRKQRTRHLGQSTRNQGPRTNQPTKVLISRHVLTRDFSTLTREIRHGSSRPDPHEIRTSRVTRSVASRVGSGRVGSGRVWSGRVNSLSNVAGRVGSCQDFSKSLGSGGVRSFKRFQNLSGRVGSADPSRHDSTREV